MKNSYDKGLILLKSFSDRTIFSEDDYEKQAVDIPTHLFKSPQLVWRDVTNHELASWADYFRDTTYDTNIWLLSVTQVVCSGCERYVLLDGRRKCFALCNLRRETRKTEESTLKVLLWGRKD